MGLVTLIFDLETGMRVASKVGNLPSKVGNARPLGSRIIRYIRDGQRDRRTKAHYAMLIASFPTGGGIINSFLLPNKQNTNIINCKLITEYGFPPKLLHVYQFTVTIQQHQTQSI